MNVKCEVGVGDGDGDGDGVRGCELECVGGGATAAAADDRVRGRAAVVEFDGRGADVDGEVEWLGRAELWLLDDAALEPDVDGNATASPALPLLGRCELGPDRPRSSASSTATTAAQLPNTVPAHLPTATTELRSTRACRACRAGASSGASSSTGPVSSQVSSGS